jgi:hypothetical protein
VFMWNCHEAKNPSKGTACFVCHKLLFKLSRLLQRMNTSREIIYFSPPISSSHLPISIETWLSELYSICRESVIFVCIGSK